MKAWVYDPHSGGKKIPSEVREQLCKEIESYALTRPWYSEHRLVTRFKSQFCYIDTMDVKNSRIFPLCRLRHFKQNSFSMALFTYSNERYEPCVFTTESGTGTIIEALKLCEPFIF